MNNLFIDLETIPVQDEELKTIVASNVKAPANYKDPAKIADYIFAHKDDAILKTSFSGMYGNICCIGYAVDDGEVKSITADNEIRLLANFWLSMTEEFGAINHPVWIGHNHTQFDLRFLWQRSVINGIKPSLTIPVDAKPWSKEVYDTLYHWTGNNTAGGSLDAIAKVLGLGGKTGGITGADVWPMYQAGKIEEIAEYCRQDVHLTREIYKRLNFIDTVADTKSQFAA